MINHVNGTIASDTQMTHCMFGSAENGEASMPKKKRLLLLTKKE